MLAVDWARFIPLAIRDHKALASHPTNWAVNFPEAWVAMSLSGQHFFFLEFLADSWASGELCRPCPSCSRQAYVLNATLGLFSRRGQWRGVCACTHGLVGTTRPESMSIGEMPVLAGHTGELGYQPILQDADPWIFSFKHGAVQQGFQRQEIRLEVPTWDKFLAENYPECLVLEAESK